MRKLPARCILAIFIVFLTAMRANAHPLDISLTTLQVSASGFIGTTYIHPYEISLLLDSRGLAMDEVAVPELRRIVLSYFDEHFSVYGKGGMVNKHGLYADAEELYQVLARGLYLNYLLPIEEDQYPVSFEVDLFVEFFNTQTNKLILLDASGQPLPGSREVFLTARRTGWSFDPSQPDFSSEYDDWSDTDGDGMSDRLESLYGLDPANSDTDGDGYSDFIEFSFGWDPFDAEPSEGQSQEAVSRGAGGYDAPQPVPAADSEGEQKPRRVEEAEGAASDSRPEAGETGNLIEANKIRDRRIARSKLLERVLAKLSRTVETGFTFGSMVSVLFSIFLLGFLHASMPGHGKGILLSFLAQEKRKFIHALRFIVTFTVTHLVDVIILSFGLKILSSAYQSARVSQILKFVGGAGLLLVAVFLVVQGIRDIAGNKAPGVRRQEPVKAGKSGGALVLGFLTGLAPCPFGWAILMILLSLGRPDLIPPVIIVFGLGIFSFLLLLTLGIMFFRAVVMDLFSKFSRYSRLVSGTLLLVFSVLFFTPTVPTI